MFLMFIVRHFWFFEFDSCLETVLVHISATSCISYLDVAHCSVLLCSLFSRFVAILGPLDLLNILAYSYVILYDMFDTLHSICPGTSNFHMVSIVFQAFEAWHSSIVHKYS